jgi:phosphatidylglycerol:prolipoprotein diacylglycerol transferase
MHPELFMIPGTEWPISTYGLLIVIGTSLGCVLAEARVIRAGLPRGTAIDGAVISAVTGLIGSRITAVLENLDSYRDRGWVSVLYIWEGGLTYYGGLFLGLGSLFIYAWLRKLGWKGIVAMLDLGGPSMALSLAIARLGCFFNGCCYGRPSSLPLPLAVRFPVGSIPHIGALTRAGWIDDQGFFVSQRLEAAGVAPESLEDLGAGLAAAVERGAIPGPETIFATQLFESFYCFVLFLFLYFYLWPRQTSPGQTSIAFLSFYAIGRFLEEFLRGDNPPVTGLLTISQIMALVFLALMGFWIVWRHKHPRAEPAPESTRKIGKKGGRKG